MRLMVLSVGRRVEIVEFFKKVFNKKDDKVFTLDMSPYAPALYEGDEYFLIKKDMNKLDEYMKDIIKICRTHSIDAIMTLIDPELSLLARYRECFLKEDIVPIVSEEQVINVCFDKYLFYKELSNKIPVIPTYNNYQGVMEGINSGKIEFPLFAKMRYGSGSIGVGKIEDKVQLSSYQNKQDYIFQPFMEKREYGVDVYFDMIDGKIKSLFIKEKLAMRAGETDKAISVYREDIIELVMKLEELKFRGPIDIDIFEDEKGELYINEINPRFGGGYPHAYNAGVNFMEYIYNNLQGDIGREKIGGYKLDCIMLKYNGAKYLEKNIIDSL